MRSGSPTEENMVSIHVEGGADFQQEEVLSWIKREGAPRWLRGREPACQCRRHRLDPWVRRCPGGGDGTPLQYSCLENLMDTGAWRTTVHGVTKSQTRLSTQQRENEEGACVCVYVCVRAGQGLVTCAPGETKRC